jgi:hypothetical protein
MSIRRFCAIAIAALAMAGGVSASSQAGSGDWYPNGNSWYPNGAYGFDNSSSVNSNRYFRRGIVTCDRVRDICYDRYGISYHATARYLGEREANQAYRKYGNKVFLFSPQRGITCDRRTETCTVKQRVGNNYGNWSDRSNTQARDGFGATGSSNDRRYRQQQRPHWLYDND